MQDRRTRYTDNCETDLERVNGVQLLHGAHAARRATDLGRPLPQQRRVARACRRRPQQPPALTAAAGAGTRKDVRDVSAVTRRARIGCSWPPASSPRVGAGLSVTQHAMQALPASNKEINK